MVGPAAVEPFASVLRRHGLELARGETTALQVNVGRLCNQTCRHCHVDAGPDREEVMSREILEACLEVLDRPLQLSDSRYQSFGPWYQWSIAHFLLLPVFRLTPSHPATSPAI